MRKNIVLFFTNPIKVAILIVLSIVSIFYFYSSIVYNNLKYEIINALGETTKHTATALEERISSDKKTMDNVATALSNDHYNSEEAMTILRKITKKNNYLRMGIINKDFTVFSTDDAFNKLPDRPYITNAFKGELSISDPLMDIVNGKPVIVYGAPIYNNNFTEINSVLFGTFSIYDYQKELTNDIFNLRGSCFVIKQNGTIVSSFSYINLGNKKYTNLFEQLKMVEINTVKSVDNLKNNIELNKEGYVELYNISKNDYTEKMYFYYTPLKVNDWYLVTSVPTQTLHNKMLSTITSTFILACIIVAITCAILLVLIRNLKQSKKTLEDIIYTNEVTGQMSYPKFKVDSLEILLDNPSDQFAFITFDIEKFKYINDRFGYAEGDRLIRYIDATLRESCPSNEITAHVGADNFVLLLHYENRRELCNRLDHLLEEIEKYSRPNNSYYNISVSIGVYEIAAGERNIDAMKDRAEIPMKQLKECKTYSYGFYEEGNRKQILFERELENRMNEALSNEEFVVYYQPKYDGYTQRLCGAEALVRWQQRDGSLLSPFKFIPLFEHNGFIVQLDEYVFKRVCKDIKEWIEKGYKVVPISCNLSRKNIAFTNLADTYEAIINDIGISADHVSLEITESAFIENDSLIKSFVAKLNNKNFKVIMDDFGVGFSSIGLLKDINVHTLKLDRSFVVDILENTKTYNIVETIIKLMKQWNVRVNAEGVETIEQLNCLRQLNCDEIQGYYYSMPIDKKRFEEKMEK